MGRGLQIITSTLGHLRQSQDRINRINETKIEREQKNALFDLQKQKYELDIKEKQAQGEMDRFEADYVRQIFGNQVKAQKANFQTEEDMIDVALKEESGKMRGLTDLLQQGVRQEVQEKSLGRLRGHPVSNAMTAPDTGYETSWSSRSGLSFKPKKSKETKTTTTDRVLGAIKSGGMYDKITGRQFKFKDRKIAEVYAQNNLGIDWQQKYPRAVKILDEKFGISLPPEISSTSEALKFLIGEKQMDRDQAVQWLRQNQDRNIKVR